MSASEDSSVALLIPVGGVALILVLLLIAALWWRRKMKMLGPRETAAVVVGMSAASHASSSSSSASAEQVHVATTEELTELSVQIDERSTAYHPKKAPPAKKHSVFISFRFAEAEAEANALKQELDARGHYTFVSNEKPGSNLQKAIADALGQSKVQVLLATKTYGKMTNQQYSTFQEMNYALNHNPFLVKMPANVEWEETSAEMALDGRMWVSWKPGEPVPAGLVDQIIAKMH